MSAVGVRRMRDGMDPRGGESYGGANAGVEGENCLREIANNYVEEEDGEYSSGSEGVGVARENGGGYSGRGSHGRGGRDGVVGNGTGVCEDSADDSGGEGGEMEVSSGSSGEEHCGESSEEDVEGEAEGEVGGEMVGVGVAGNGYMGNEEEVGGYPGELGGGENGQEATESGGVGGGPTLRRRRGRPLKSSERMAGIRAGPITPKLEEPRAVRVNRGIKRRFPGDESEDSLPKRIRVRSIASVCGDVSLTVKGEDLSMEESLEATPARKRGRPRKSEGGQGQGQGVVKADEGEVSLSGENGKRKMVEAVLDADNLKRPCHGKIEAGTTFACNAEGCKKRFAEAGALYAHARVHGDRPYVCHYDGCIKSFSERSKLKRHFLIHTGEKPFLCLYEGCGKAFSLDFNLRSHMKTHTGEYNECPYEGCDKRYCQEYKLRAHIAKEHTKAAKGSKKVAKVVGNDGRGSNGSRARDLAALKKREMLLALMTKRSRLESVKEGRMSRMKELEEEMQREAREVGRIDQDLRRLERARRRVEERGAGSPGVSVSEEEEDADDEEDGEDGEEEEVEEEEGEEASASEGTGGETSSSGEQQSRLEYTAMGEGKDVIMFAHKLPTADQGARLVRTMEARAAEGVGEATTSLTPMLWLQGPPPHHGHLAGASALRPMGRCGRAALRACSSMEEKERTAGESSDSGMVKANGGVKWAGGSGVGVVKGRGVAGRRSAIGVGRGGVKAVGKRSGRERDGENGRVEQRPPQRHESKEVVGRAGRQGSGGRALSSEAVFVNPILLSSDHRFSPTDARFLSNQEFPSMAQAMLRDRLSKEAVKSAGAGAGVSAMVPKEKVYRSMNEVLHSSTGDGGCSGPGEGLGVEQGPSEQSFEPSAAQLFTYHEQSRLVE